MLPKCRRFPVICSPSQSFQSLAKANADGSPTSHHRETQATCSATKAIASGTSANGGAGGIHTLFAQPGAQGGLVEANKAPHLEKWDTTLIDEALYVPPADSQGRGSAVDVHQWHAQQRRFKFGSHPLTVYKGESPASSRSESGIFPGLMDGCPSRSARHARDEPVGSLRRQRSDLLVSLSFGVPEDGRG